MQTKHLNNAALLLGAGVVALSSIGGAFHDDKPVEASMQVVAATADEPGKQLGHRSVAESAGATKAAVAATGDVYVPITPFRTMDSRLYSDGFMQGGYEIYFDVLTDLWGAAKVPSNAVAVTYNLTVTETVGSGYLSIYPGDSTWPGTSAVNWQSSGETIANGGTVALGSYSAPGQVFIFCGPASTALGAKFVLDITGYYI
jgi:hypothetical protein